MSNPITAANIERKVAEAIFGKKLITNVYRGHVTEAIVAAALEPEWNWCLADYSSWDFERDDGMRLEVKQSAVLQTWTIEPPKRITGSFDIAERQGYWEGPAWVAVPGRCAHVYVLAHHIIVDDSADHRDPGQWQFYVVRASELPAVKKISLGSLQRLAQPCGFDELSERVAQAATQSAAAA
jgi:hypothetical protein